MTQPFPAHGHAASDPAPRMYQSAKGLAVAASVLAGLGALIEVVDVPLAWFAAEQLEDAAARGTTPDQVVTPFDVMGLPTLGLFVAAWVVTSLWLSRARVNAEALNPGRRHKRSAGWAWFGWLVPVVSYWFPYQYVRDVRLATVAGERRRSTVVGWWWGTWLVSQHIGWIGGWIVMPAGSDTFRFGLLAPVEAAAAVVAVAALVCWLRIVRQITEDQAAVARGRPTTTV
ncbi:MAG TPA: DUF4328 domain-containing protein [Nocardioidaceae bacterium]|nr:DUF4328 domain-containing protein [Nocardioidaceae bacterium]